MSLSSFLEFILFQRILKVTQKFPLEMYSISEMYRLGKPIKVYETDFHFYVSFLLGITGVLLIFTLSVSFYNAKFDFSQKYLLLYAILILINFFVVSIYAAFLLTPRFHHRKTRIYVYECGLAYKNQDNILVIYWQQIKNVTLRTNFCELLLNNGTTITFPENIQGIQLLGRMIKRKITKIPQQGVQND